MARWLALARRIAVNLAIAAVSIVATVALFEVGAWFFAPEWTPKHGVRNFWAHHELLGWAHRPNASGTHYHRDFRVSVRTNEHGFRDRDYPVERVPGRQRMLFLGDSFGFGFGVERDEILTEIIEARHPDWEIINTAVAGWGTDQQLLFLREIGSRFRPDVVLLLFHPNDVEDNNDRMRYGYYKPQFVLEDGELELTQVPVRELNRDQKIDRFLYQRTYALHKLWNWRDVVDDWRDERARSREAERALAAAADGAGAAAGTPDVAAAPASAEAEPAPPPNPCGNRKLDFAVSRALLRALDREVRSLGAKLVVVSVPGGCPDPRDLLSELMPELDVPYRPLNQAFHGLPREAYGFAHDPHWTADGQRIAADATEAFLQALGILDAARGEGS